ncbi:M20 family metallopeptidase [Actinomadura alba]
MLDRLGELVSCESPAGSAPHLAVCADLLAGWGGAVLHREPRRIVRDGVPHLLWQVPDQRVLLLGHFDTVWPAGTLARWPFTVDGAIATGPGVCDMKSGIVQMFAALALQEDTSHIGVLLTGDEESGSVTSRSLVEAEARRSRAVLVCEPSTPSGELKVARKGGSAYRLTVHGRASHAGVEPHAGVNATVEVAHQILAVQNLAAPARGTSVTPTALSSGTTSNTVPEKAVLAIDVRSWTGAELDRVDRMIRRLEPRLPDAGLSFEGGVNRYPLVADMARGLLEMAREEAKELGLEPPDGTHASGASDANFTGALGVPTLDGLGGVGGGAHARDEYVDVRRMPERAALLAALVDRLATTPFRTERARRGAPPS